MRCASWWLEMRESGQGRGTFDARFRPAAETRLMSATGDWLRRDELQRLLRHGARGPDHVTGKAT